MKSKIIIAGSIIFILTLVLFNWDGSIDEGERAQINNGLFVKIESFEEQPPSPNLRLSDAQKESDKIIIVLIELENPNSQAINFIPGGLLRSENSEVFLDYCGPIDFQQFPLHMGEKVVLEFCADYIESPKHIAFNINPVVSDEVIFDLE